MTVALGLLAYAVLLCTAGAALLRRARWAAHAPRLAIVAWLALVASAVTSVVLGGIGVTMSLTRVSGGLAELLRSCALALQHQYAVPGGAYAAAAGAAVTTVLALRVAYCLGAAVVRAARQQRAHRRILAMVGRRDPDLDVVVVDHEVPAAYCVPGRRGEQVVVSSAAVRTLGHDELAAVLAHERAHLRGRHHLVVLVAAAVGRVVPFVPAFRVAKGEVERLLELLADDAAARSCPRRTVAEALLAVGGTRMPGGALAASGSATAQRVRRLLAAERPPRRLTRWSALGVAGTVLVVPLLVATAPAFAITQLDYCPVGAHHVHETPHLHVHH